jgi:Rieske Fe-S protein
VRRVRRGQGVRGEKVVVSQPSAGKFKAFSAVCTHQQCIVDRVSNGTIDCPCHGSEFSVKNGSVVAGPAPSPLPEKSINVAGGKITLADSQYSAGPVGTSPRPGRRLAYPARPGAGGQRITRVTMLQSALDKITGRAR